MPLIVKPLDWTTYYRSFNKYEYHTEGKTSETKEKGRPFGIKAWGVSPLDLFKDIHEQMQKSLFDCQEGGIINNISDYKFVT